ncbi:YjgP/YjgQ family permease [bacterium]|nr:YjgP/YjgQ family permease [bacterium]
MKLTKLDFYIIKRFLFAFLLTLGLFTVIIIVFDLAEKIDNFIEHDAPFKDVIFKYYVNWVPFLLNLFSPVFVFISVIFFTSKMAQKSEIVSILASGVSYVRLLVPYVLTSILLAFMSFSLFAWVIPRTDKVRVDFENTYIRERHLLTKRGIKRQIQPGVVMTVENFIFSDSVGYRLSLEHIEEGKLESKMYAEKLVWDRRNETWQVKNYWIRNYKEEGEEISKGMELDTMIPFEPEDFFRQNDDVQMFDMKELDRMIELEYLKGTGRSHFYRTEKHKRYASPFAILVLTVIGVCVSSRKTRGGIGLNLGIGLLLSFSYIFIMQFFLAYGSSGAVSPALAVWIPNILFSLIAYVLYRTAQK